MDEAKRRFKLDTDIGQILYHQLEAYSAVNRVSKAETIREALRQYFSKQHDEQTSDIATIPSVVRSSDTNQGEREQARLRMLSWISNNINQIAKAVNTHVRANDTIDVRFKEKINKQLAKLLDVALRGKVADVTKD
jgi:hypothetical protein